MEKDLIRDLIREKDLINKHYDHIILMRLDDCESKEKLQLIVGNIFTSVLLISIENSLHKERFKLFKTYNKKIAKLIKNKKDDTFANYSAPVINLSNYTLNDSECSQLKFGLNHCASKQVEYFNLFRCTIIENFHEFSREYTYIFRKTFYLATMKHTKV